MLDLLYFNYHWMQFNISLAVIPVILAWLAYLIKNKLLKILLLIIWLLFIPNTVYIVTDIIHLIEQYNKVSLPSGILLYIQYIIFILLGLLAFILSLYPIEEMLKKHYKKQKENITLLLIALNFLMGFGIVLGRIHRLNSWDIIFGLDKIIYSAIDVISSPDMILLAVLFGLFSNLVYFLFKEKIIKIISRLSTGSI